MFIDARAHTLRLRPVVIIAEQETLAAVPFMLLAP